MDLRVGERGRGQVALGDEVEGLGEEGLVPVDGVAHDPDVAAAERVAAPRVVWVDEGEVGVFGAVAEGGSGRE